MEGQLIMAERNRNDLEAYMLKKSTAEAEKKVAEEKWLKACDQWNKLEKEAEEAKRQLHEVEVCTWRCIITYVKRPEWVGTSHISNILHTLVNWEQFFQSFVSIQL